MYETATRFAARAVRPLTIIPPKRNLTAQKCRKFLRDYRLRRLDELMQRHKGDIDYDSVMAVWRREKCDLLEQGL